MSKSKRFTWKTEKLQHLDDEIIMVVDNDNKDWKGHILNIVDRLNELAEENEQLKIANARWLDKSLQDKQIRYSNANHKELTKKYLQLKEENEQLRKELNDCEKFRYSVFKGMEKTLEEKKNDNGGFQVWEVPPITMGKRISFTTNNDGGDGV